MDFPNIFDKKIEFRILDDFYSVFCHGFTSRFVRVFIPLYYMWGVCVNTFGRENEIGCISIAW